MVEPNRALPAQEGDRLELLTERLPETGSAAPPPSIGTGVVSLVHQAVDHIEHKKEALCPHIGPFESEEEAKSITELLAADGYQATISRVEISRKVDNWVLIPARESRKASLQLLRELQTKKIDSYLVAEGDQRNAISLGLFQKSSSALGVQEKMAAAGYEAEIRTLERIDYEYWAQVNMADESSEREIKLEKDILDKKNVSFSKTLCETFAQRG